jgi:hypothetical protein
VTETRRAIDFLEGVGVPTRRTRSVPKRTFVPGVWVDHGVLVYNPARLRFHSNLYHEAGHLAVTPSLFRPLVARAMNFGEPPAKFEEALDGYMAEHPDGLTTYPEDPVCRGILQMGEAEAIAWSYAAMVAAGADMDVSWREDPKLFNGGAPEVRLQLDARSHFGINGLQAAGMTTVRTFPTMTRWLQV